MNYYNEFDKKAAAWLRELIKQGLIPNGIVDERSITDVRADELMGFQQCHFFAGIGGWSEALRLAGIGADERIWTGSCPCQSFSTAGKQKGFDDKRDLWPAFFGLIKECKPELVFGEQVENAIRHDWLDRVYTDLEGENYTVGAVVLGAHSVGAPHKRQRLFWGAERVSDSHGQRCQRKSIPDERKQKVYEITGNSSSVRISDTTSRGSGGLRDTQRQKRACGGNVLPRELRGVCNNAMDDCISEGLERHTGNGGDRDESGWDNKNEIRPASEASLSNNHWSDFQLIYCRDTDKDGNHKVRRVPAESLLFGMVDGVSDGVDKSRDCSLSTVGGFPLCQKEDFGRGEISMLLKGIGNAIVPEVAAEFLKAWMKETNQNSTN